ncbi:MAG: hypothetical protein J6Z82_04690 [Schwartzia sp.]|nr:hypothetical protein [Schwartzia sp. (in: firmicutes)]
MKRTLSVFSKTVSVQNFANRLSPFFADSRNLSDNLQVKIVSKAGQNFHSDFLRDFGKTASFRRFCLAIRETDFFRVPHFAREKTAKSKNRIDKETLNKSKLATPISNGGLIVAPPGHYTGSANGGARSTIVAVGLPWRLSLNHFPSNLSSSP